MQKKKDEKVERTKRENGKEKIREEEEGRKKY